MVAISRRSWPEVNAAPRPVSTTARMPSSLDGIGQRPGHRRVHGAVEGVADFGPVEGDQPDAVAVLDVDAVLAQRITVGPLGRRRR